MPLFKPSSLSKPSPGVVTRMYMAEEEDHGRHEAGDYWYVPGMADFFTKSWGKFGDMLGKSSKCWRIVGQILQIMGTPWGDVGNWGKV